MNKFQVIAFQLMMLIFIACTPAAEQSATLPEPADSISKDTTTTESRKKVMLFFGNSITAAYGLTAEESFTTMIQMRLDSLGKSYEVINAGVSGETTATGKNRVGWVVKRQPVDIFILELGANDGLRGVPAKETRANLESIIDQVREAHPDAIILLAGMMIPPSMGPEYSNEFSKIFPAVAEKKNVRLIPFILENVAGIDTLNLPDGIHPNAAGEKIVMENVWDILKEVI